jgi:hypothetical protein
MNFSTWLSEQNLLQHMRNTVDVENLRSGIQVDRHTMNSINDQVDFASANVSSAIFSDFDGRSRALELHSDVDAIEVDRDGVASEVALVVLAVNVQLSGGRTQFDSVQHAVDQNVLVLSIQLAHDALTRLELHLALAGVEGNGARIVPTENSYSIKNLAALMKSYLINIMVCSP